MTNDKIDNLLAEKLMKWTHVKNDNMTKTDETVFMFFKSKKVLRGIAYDVTENLTAKERKAWFGDVNGLRYDHSFEEWSPTTNVAHAFEVVEKIREKFSNFSLGAANGWGANAWQIDAEGETKRLCSATGDTPMEAICNLALAVLRTKS